jgi:alkanesulfonate monooxygenase SsuD/methylene tetrahydromethanopterin reductase-like flavin-dependent oxidoreductase (luciferase family)
VLATAIAARTSRVHVATTVIQPTYHHPVHLAEQLAMIDQLSKGRLIFGAGVGYHADYFRLFGVPMKRRDARFEESLKVIEGVWTQDHFSFTGQFYEFDDIVLTPKPCQHPIPDRSGVLDKAIERSTGTGGSVVPSELERRAEIEYWRESTNEEKGLVCRLACRELDW